MEKDPSLRVASWVVLALLGAAAFCLALVGCGGGGAAPGGNPDGGNPGGGDSFVQHNLDGLNQYRAQNGAAALVLDSQLNDFAAAGSQELLATMVPHQHFKDASASGAIWTSGFCHTAGENQAPGWPASSDPVELSTIDSILQQMMAEGPGGGHHDNIVNPQFTRVGIALLVQNGQVWFTNDFSGACP